MFNQSDNTLSTKQHELGVIGVSYKTSVLSDREYLSNSERLYDKFSVSGLEHVVINTCNRTEVVYSSPHADFTTATDFFSSTLFPTSESQGAYRYQNTEAITHFYRVAAGLDSMVLGEAEILGQMKKAYSQAVRGGSVRTVLHKLFQSAFRTAKEIRTNTGIGKGRISVASTAVEAAASVFGKLEGLNVLLVGAGETSQLLVSHLLKHGVSKFYVSNRTEQNAKKLVEATKGIFIPLDKISMVLPHVDIIAVAISHDGSSPLIKSHDFKELIAKQHRKTYCFLDLSVPRAVDIDIANISSTYLFNIDNIESIAKQNLDYRTLEAVRAEEIIRSHVDEFIQWQNERVYHQHIKKLFSHYKVISRIEIEKIFQIETTGNMKMDDKIEKIVSSMAKKFYAPLLTAVKSGKINERDLEKIIEQLTDQQSKS